MVGAEELQRFSFDHPVFNLANPESAALLGISPEVWNVAFTFLLMISTVGLWFVTWKTLHHARESSEKSLRPYVLGKEVINTNMRDAGTHNIARRDIRIFWENVGATPARRVSLRVSWSARKNYPPTEPKYYLQYQMKEDDSLVTIGARQLTHVTAEIPNQHFIQNPKVFIWSWVEYDDGFGHRRKSECCYEALIDGDPATSETVKLRFWGPCNGTDDTSFTPMLTT